MVFLNPEEEIIACRWNNKFELCKFYCVFCGGGEIQFLWDN